MQSFQVILYLLVGEFEELIVDLQSSRVSIDESFEIGTIFDERVFVFTTNFKCKLLSSSRLFNYVVEGTEPLVLGD